MSPWWIPVGLGFLLAGVMSGLAGIRSWMYLLFNATNPDACVTTGDCILAIVLPVLSIVSFVVGRKLWRSID